MSQFFDQYNAILEKSLQRVRLKVDPSNKCAEDFAQFNGYVGYILAETDDSIEFFYNNNTVTLPKNAVFIEGLGDVAKATGRAIGAGAGNFIRGAAGQNTGASVAGALGSIAGSAAKGAANFGSMLYTGQKLFDGKNQQAGTPAQAVDKTKSLLIKNKNGNASIIINGVDYGIINIKDANNKSLVMLNNNVLILAHYNAFNLVLNRGWSFLSEIYETEFDKKKRLKAEAALKAKQAAASAPAAYVAYAPAASAPAASAPAASAPAASAPAASAPAASAPAASAPAASAPAASAPNNTTAVPAVSAANAFLQMPSVTVSALNAKKLLGVPLVVSLSPITQPNATNKPVTPIDYSVKFTAAPNNADVLVTFL
jgi:hypothetical protein